MAKEPENTFAKTLVSLSYSKVDLEAAVFTVGLLTEICTQCFSSTKCPVTFKKQGWNHIFGLPEHMTMTCSAWSPKPPTL